MVSIESLPGSMQDILALPRVHLRDRGLLPTASGIYFVLYETDTPRLAYVGKGENLRKRWVGHHRLPECNLLDSLGIPVELAWVLAEQGVLTATEEHLIATLNPPLNDRHGIRRARQRLNPHVPTSFTSTADVIGDLRSRREHAFQLLMSERLWDECNKEEDGDLMCVWAWPDGAELVSVGDLWACSDSHELSPSRVVCPPAVAANTSGVVEPAAGFTATAGKRRSWVAAVARQVDGWLAGVLVHHAAQLPARTRAEAIAALAAEPSLEEMVKAAPL